MLKDSHGLAHLGATSLVMGLRRGRPHPSGRRRARGHLRARHPVHPDRRAVPDERGRPHPQPALHRVRRRTSPTSYPILWPHISRPRHHLGRLSAADRPGPAHRRASACSTATRTASPRRNATCWSRSAAASRRASSGPCSTSRSTTSPRASSRPCCRAGSPSVPGARDRRPLPLGPARPGHRRRLVRRDPAARRPGRRRHRRRPGPRHARGRRHGTAAHRAARVRGRGAHPGHGDGPRLRLPARTRHRPLRDLHVRRGRPVHRRRPAGPGRPYRPAGPATPTAAAAGCPSRAGCRWACRPSSAGSSTRSPRSSWTPARRCCCAPTAWSSSPAPTSTTACRLLTALIRTGPRRPPATWPTGSARWSTSAAATTTWRCCCCAARPRTRPQAGGRLQQHVAPERPGGADRRPGT